MTTIVSGCFLIRNNPDTMANPLSFMGSGGSFLGDCGIHLNEISIPILKELANADSFNSAFASFVEEVVSENCSEPRSSNYGESDTAFFLDVSSHMLQQTQSLISLEVKAVFVPNGGNGWWMNHRIWNIDTEEGKVIDVPQEEILAACSDADSLIAKHFAEMQGCSRPYACHSCVEPDYLIDAVENGHIGIEDGMWVAHLVIWPDVCAHNTKSMLSIPLLEYRENS
jgi:hypothetical protein